MPIYKVDGKMPNVHPSAWVAPGAILIGDVTVGEGASIWYGAILRADSSPIVIGANSAVEEHCTVHGGIGTPVYVGQNCIIGHGAMLEGCTIGDNSVIGAMSTVFEGNVGCGSMVAAGSVVPRGVEIPDGVLAAGVPARVKRKLSGHARDFVENGAGDYARWREMHRRARLVFDPEEEEVSRTATGHE